MSLSAARSSTQMHLLLALAIVLATLFSALTIQTAEAAGPYNVNSTADAPDADITDGDCQTAANECTLRAAIEQANADSDGVISIIITVYTPGTYTLGSQLEIRGQNIFIYGTGNESQVIIDGNSTTRVFDIAAGASVSVFWMTLQGGKNVNSAVVPGHWHGGAIHNHGELTMGDVIIQDSVIASDTPGPVTCTTHCGGAIYNAATATLDDVTFVNNRNEFSDAAAHGAAIANAGTMTVTNATFSDNSTSGGHGSAMYSSGTTSLTHGTVAHNATGSAIAQTSGTFNLTASILTNNTGANCFGSITSGGYNLSDDGTCAGSLTGPGDQNNNANANLGPLADNGGNTLTHALLSGSEAINAISPGVVGCGTTIATDQRGETRPQGAGCDIGAFEVIFVQTYYQACLYAGSLSQVSSIGASTTTTVSCGRGTPVVLVAGGDPGVEVYHACLYAGSLSQVDTIEPSNCGRGTAISLVLGTDLLGCRYAGSLSRLSTSSPSTCGRGVAIGLMSPP